MASWTIINVRFGAVFPLAVATATIAFAPPVFAVGTTAGTTIANTATATYTDAGGNAVNVPSNTINLRVDELLDVTVASADPGDVQTTPGATNQVLSFNVTNTGNGSEAFILAAINAIGGDAFDPNTTSIVIDGNGNGVYDAGVDTVYATGTNDPVLAPDASVRVFVLSTTPAGATDGQRGQTDLTAAARTGTGTPGTSFSGQGTGGGDAVVGATGGDGRDDGFYAVTSATVAFVKSATIVDPFGGARIVPGSIVTYTLVATVTGSGSLANLAATDPVPANTTYQPNTLTLQGSALSDAADGDAGEVTGAGNVIVRFGTVAGGSTRTVAFRVKIN